MIKLISIYINGNETTVQRLENANHYTLKHGNKEITCDKRQQDFNETIIEFKQILEQEQNKLVEA